MFHTQGCGHFFQSAETDEGRVFTHFFHLFTVFNVDVGRSVFLVMFDGEAIAGRRAFAAQTLHFRSDDMDTELTEAAVTFDD